MVAKVVDLFSGCGGLSEGFRLSGFEIVGGFDKDKSAIETFSYNFPNARAVCGDIEKINDEDIPFLFNLIGDIDVIIGGPPCQGFSSANRWNKELEDPRNKLFYEFIKFVQILKPKYVLLENVRGILTKDNGYAKNRIYQILEMEGYNVDSAILDASEFGVPQRRLRAFFLATRKDLNQVYLSQSKSKSKPTVVVKDAIGELYSLENHVEENKSTYHLEVAPDTLYRRYLRDEQNVIKNHEVRYPAKIQQERISYVPQGGNWRDIPSHMFSNDRKNRHSSAYKRLDENDVSVTIDTGNAHSNYFHTIYNRIPTVREAARLQSFKDNFIFLGSRTSQYRQVGNAVPPLLAKSIAEVVKGGILNEKAQNNRFV